MCLRRTQVGWSHNTVCVCVCVCVCVRYYCEHRTCLHRERLTPSDSLSFNQTTLLFFLSSLSRRFSLALYVFMSEAITACPHLCCIWLYIGVFSVFALSFVVFDAGSTTFTLEPSLVCCSCAVPLPFSSSSLAWSVFSFGMGSLYTEAEAGSSTDVPHPIQQHASTDSPSQ